MKFSLVAVLVVLALAQGSLAQDALDVDKITQYFNEWKEKLSQQLSAPVDVQQFADNAQTIMNEKKVQLDKMVADMTEQMKAKLAELENQFKPQAENVQAKLQAMAATIQTQMEALIQKVTDQTHAITN
ncbi:type-4 ice-structuring protein LS-12-like [Thalassophryne amazonica]|uniref:type-4 ice-structuring protein LS-12-like n=1 Tax=Thalassophryne amazonica TaxID=390379 RepID=UPI0014711F6E|nr:type-4 ice-structuring protein LS-12-like [Thalassophryne amazonica]